MATLKLTNLSTELLSRLELRAKEHGKTVEEEVIAILGNAFRQVSFPPPYKGKVLLTDELLDRAKRSGRP